MKLTLPFPPSVNSYWRAPSKGPLKGRHLVSETGRKFQQAARAAIIEQLRAVPGHPLIWLRFTLYCIRRISAVGISITTTKRCSMP